MRQGAPWTIYSASCRRHYHVICPHGQELESAGSRYFLHCACDCHPRTKLDSHELQELRRRLADSGALRGCYNPGLPALPTDIDQAENAGRRRRLNPQAELVELANRQSRGFVPRSGDNPDDTTHRRVTQSDTRQQPLPAPAPTTTIACLETAEHVISVAVDPQARDVAKALECRGCKTKRQVVRWKSTGYYRTITDFQLCAVCILEALALLLEKNITRRGREKAGKADDGKTTAPDGGALTPRRKKAPRPVQQPRGARRIHQADRRRRRVRSKRRRQKR